jgi:hypothetical protein
MGKFGLYSDNPAASILFGSHLEIGRIDIEK